MSILSDYELNQIFGGGYWWQAPNGLWVYIDDDEEPDGDDIICG